MKDSMFSPVRLVKDFAAGIGERRLAIYAASGCYYMFMSLVPIVMIACCILPYTPFSQELVFSYIDQYVAEQIAKILHNIVKAVYSSNGATLTISIFLTLFSASKSMKAVMHGMDAAYNCTKKRNVVIFTLQSLLYMIFMIIAILVSLFVMVYGGKILDLSMQYLPDLVLFEAMLRVLRFCVPLVLLTLFFLMLFRVTPSEKLKLHKHLPGAVLTALMWVGFSYIFSLYVGISNQYGAYGYIGTVMVAMMWINYCLLFLLVGGYTNSFLEEGRKRNREVKHNQ